LCENKIVQLRINLLTPRPPCDRHSPHQMLLALASACTLSQRVANVLTADSDDSRQRFISVHTSGSLEMCSQFEAEHNAWGGALIVREGGAGAWRRRRRWRSPY